VATVNRSSRSLLTAFVLVLGTGVILAWLLYRQNAPATWSYSQLLR
jgi:hypothetical protein